MDTISCPYCSQDHPVNAQFCPVTGKVLQSQSNICHQCGANLPLEVGFCPICGTAPNVVGSSVAHPWLSQALRKPPIQRVLFFCSIFVVGLLVIILNNVNFKMPSQKHVNENSSLSTATYEVLQDTPTPLLNSIPFSVPSTTSTPETLTSPIDSKTNIKDDAEIVFIPSGNFLMGSDQNKDPYFWGAESPEHTVTLSSYWIYRTEVTQGMYQKCAVEKSCPSPEVIDNSVAQQYGNSRFTNYPVVMVSWQYAHTYCQWAGARLPTEAEWEKAARGSDGRLFPWGNDANADGRANYLSSSPSPVGSYPTGASPYGVYDMAGNVLEWVNDYFESSYYQYSSLDNPTGPDSGSRRIIRGGAFSQEEVAGLRTVARASLKPGDTKINVGFRCVIDIP